MATFFISYISFLGIPPRRYSIPSVFTPVCVWGVDLSRFACLQNINLLCRADNDGGMLRAAVPVSYFYFHSVFTDTFDNVCLGLNSPPLSTEIPWRILVSSRLVPG